MLAEWLAVAYRRRWYEAGGSWRGVLRKAEEIEALSQRSESEGFDLGDNVAGIAPKECPSVDVVAPDLGWKDKAPRAPPVPFVRWKLAAEFAHDEDLLQAVCAVGGAIIGWPTAEQPRLWVQLPSSWVAASVRATEAALKAQRDRTPPE